MKQSTAPVAPSPVRARRGPLSLDEPRVKARRGGPPAEKMATRVARTIEQEIVALGWPVGHVLGSEAELLARLKVSRATFREAVRLLEHKEVAAMRRGPGGGLVVQAPAGSSVAQVAAAYFDFADITLTEMYEASRSLSSLAIRLATENIDEEGILLLRSHVQHETEAEPHPSTALPKFEVLIADLSMNRALYVFTHALTRALWTRAQSRYVSEAPSTGASLVTELHRAHEAIASAISVGNAPLAVDRMNRHLAAFERWTESPRPRRPAGRSPWGSAAIIAPPRDGKKLAERVAASIKEKTREHGFVVGEVLGSENDFLERYDVSRAVFREAVRILEHHGVAYMRRGPGGGLVVKRPDPAMAIDAVVAYLEYLHISPDQLHDLREALESACIEMAIERSTDEQCAHLSQLADAPDSADVPMSSFHVELAQLAQNRALAFFVAVLVRLTDGDGSSCAEVNEGAASHRQIAEATAARDHALASHRLRRHLRELRAHDTGER